MSRSAPPPLPQSPGRVVPVESQEVLGAERRTGWFRTFVRTVSAFLLGSVTNTGWLASIVLHGFVLLCMGLLLVPVEHQEPPRILTAALAEDVASDVGVSTGELDLGASLESTITPPATPFSSGGSMESNRPDLSALVGQTAGLGSGSGRGSGTGDGVGADIAGRVEAAGGKGGTFQISIAWDNRNDLDLHVVGPGDDRIFYGNRKGQTGGELDVDMNVEPTEDRPVENVTWVDRKPPDGEYEVIVHFYRQHPRQPRRCPFTVRLKVGDDVRLLSGTLIENRFVKVATIAVEEGRATKIETKVAEIDAAAGQFMASGESKRDANRERFAREALTEALATGDKRLRVGKLRRVIDRFRGTEAANEAARRLRELTDE